MQSREQGYEDDRFQSDVSRNLHCAICLNVFKDPVMCQRNQHSFCRPCITRHLRNSQTCPTCMEELTPETLNQAPRILRDWLSELNIRCNYFNRGCREFVQLEDLESHVKNCGYSPVTCSNQGCVMEINRQDRTLHETEICEFRKVKCHDCVEVRKEIGEVKLNLTTLAETLEGVERNQATVINKMQEMKMNLTTLTEKFEGVERNQAAVNNKIQEMKMSQTAVNDAMEEMRMNLREMKDQLATLSGQMADNIQVEREKTTNETQETGHEPGKLLDVVVAGGYNGKRRLNAVERLSLTNKSWSPLQPMQYPRSAASSFVYRNQIIVMGGETGNAGCTDTMERVNINPVMSSEPWFDFPAKLPVKIAKHSSIVYEERLIVIGGYDCHECFDSIHEVLLVPPHTSKLLTRMPQARYRHGAQLFNDKILICGGFRRWYSDILDNVIMYDISKNKCKQMSPLPYAVRDMATVSWGDNVIVIGGADKDWKALNTVVSYNVKTEKSHMLPVMRCKRKGCAAVVIGNSIVVVGGEDESGNCLKSVESFSFDSYSWEDLPPMNEARWLATAVAW